MIGWFIVVLACLSMFLGALLSIYPPRPPS